MEIFVLTLAINKLMPLPKFNLAVEEVEEKENSYAVSAFVPTVALGNKRYLKEMEYRIVRNGSYGLIGYGRDKEKLLKAYFEAVIPKELKTTLDSYTKEQLNVNADTDMSVCAATHASGETISPKAAFITNEVMHILDAIIECSTERDLANFCVNAFINDAEPLINFGYIDNQLQVLVADYNSLNMTKCTKPIGFKEYPALLNYLKEEIPARIRDLFDDECDQHVVDFCICALYYDAKSFIAHSEAEAKIYDLLAEYQADTYFNDEAKYQEVMSEDIDFPTHGEVTVYTDGSCIGNPGPGGWACVMRGNGRKRELSGGKCQTTNNRMELTGVIEALKALNEKHKITVYSDSKYIVDAINKGWVMNWKRNGWYKSDGAEAKNVDLWKDLLQLTASRTVQFRWVKGHNGIPDNERCDYLANTQAVKYERNNY